MSTQSLTPTSTAWTTLLEEARAFFAKKSLNIPAYSEFMPAPFVGIKPSGELDPYCVSKDYQTWMVSQQEEYQELLPGLEQVASHLLPKFHQLALGDDHQFSRILGITKTQFF